MFKSIPVCNGSKQDDCLEWLEALDVACQESGCDIHVETLATSADLVRACLMGMPMIKPWLSKRRNKKILL